MHHAFTNRLAKENSPYLLQHAHNPVDWYPWGEEALQKAKKENKIILVSIGYAACHWCHVMEKESFENENVAALMNETFINIKIDREERPDLDHIYMDAVQVMTGSGGWPLNVFLTPDTKPFYGGTYFPPVNAYNRSSWTEILASIKKAWEERSNEIESQAENLLEHLKQSNAFGQKNNAAGTSFFTAEQCPIMCSNILKQADTEWGGFGKAPKFPQTFTIQFLLEHFHFTGNKAALEQALLSIDKMLEGGIYDHVGGGFSRYSTDNEWLAPHFEKMLYDNALLVNVLCDAFQITGSKKYETAIRHTLSFVQRELSCAEGGFYAALDADSEGEEGRFYVWIKSEIDALLEADSLLFCAYYDVTEKGNWEGKNILRTLKDLQRFANEQSLQPEYIATVLERSVQQLLLERNKRGRPITDDKILLGWNALMVTALCKAAAALQDDNYANTAEQTFEFLIQKFKTKSDSPECRHTYKNGIAKYPAFLDDYSFLIQAALHLQKINSQSKYLLLAKDITDFVLSNFGDEESGFFFYTHKDQLDIVLRKKEVYDGALPSGNSIMAENLTALSVFFDNPNWQSKAAKMLQSLAAGITAHPTSFGIWASLLQRLTFGLSEVVVCGPEFRIHRNILLNQYLPEVILQTDAAEDGNFPMLKGKNPGKDTLIYLCKQYSCKEPVNTVEKLLEQMETQGKI
ncbi:MAG: thioredoxin domain-containing protein [Ferruginibacter sp.]